MAVLKQYVDGYGYYIRGAITPHSGKHKGKARSGEQQNVTFHITMRGVKRLFEAGVKVDQQIPSKLFQELIQSKDIFTESGKRNHHLQPVQLSLASLLSQDQSNVTLPNGSTSTRERLTRCSKCGGIVAFGQWDKHTCRQDLKQSRGNEAQNSDTQQPTNPARIMPTHNNSSKSAEASPDTRTIDFAKLNVICPICHQYVPQTDIEIHMKACNRHQQVRAMRYSLTTHKAQKKREKQKKRK